MSYKNFSKYVLRAPLFSFSFYKSLTQDKTLSEEALQKVCNDAVIKEAIFLASPSLYTEFEKWLKGDLKDKAASERMMYSVLKYVSRMSARCTPFGLFAGTAVGEFSERTAIELQEKTKNERHTRLDMNYLVALSQDIVKDKTIKDQLLFYPNTSIYKAGHQLRYVEYTYVNSRRTHHIVAVEDSEYLSKVLTKASQGALLCDLGELLVDDEITLEEANGFIDQLVESQLLISELEPSVSGPEFLDQLLPVLKKLKNADHFVTALEETQKAIHAIDQGIGNVAEAYMKIGESLKTLGTGYELKYMFQTDMVLTPKTNTLDKDVLRKVRKAMSLFNKITPQSKETLITQFKSAFYERYEDREVPLSKAMDVELGIGFLQGNDSGDISKLVDDLILPNRNTGVTSRDIKWSPIHAILQKKLIKCLQNQETILYIQDDDFKDFENKWDDLPDTISAMVEIIETDEEQKIVMSNVGGSSAANLLGRFCHGDPKLDAYTREIIATETTMNPDKILAEIVHLPESRVGNILMRPSFREYEIPYLAKSILTSEKQITLDDLMLSTRPNGPIRLRSKKYNKEVIPYLANAHNYSNNALPIYQFLANMQTQNLRGGVGFNWGPLADEYEFLPRVEYSGVIISSATWNITIKTIDKMLKSMSDETQLVTHFNQFKTEQKIPQFVLLVDGDNELLINTENTTSIKMLLATVKKRRGFILKEFLHSENSIVKEGNKGYTNQIVLSFYNEQKIKNTAPQNHG
ncbi:hypothetical protein D1816_14805 [Aquimarina sp. AD10]|uniref:lantibiotic dehydratase family protein n=1 Tax=Aquimarina sp. AD10 TaxID=1714849 RepID=UPI000E483B60|nr:lantibiotic dehydratase family protein [Aquimarina sp. AD10]AXT61565.1 hypothetical protein D1816_14805 [Aquimarina sp. AD10]RKM90049.1 hypothetical protein D7033_25325 [Aquimarina sp. AD10]